MRGRKVILHTDGAKSYRLKTTPVDGILHDWVVHKKKRKVVNGKVVWFKPKYAILVEHKLPDGKVVHAKGGTQVIDRFWQELRKHLGQRSQRVNSKTVTNRVRSAQWHYWNRGKDLWLEAGRMLTSLRGGQ